MSNCNEEEQLQEFLELQKKYKKLKNAFNDLKKRHKDIAHNERMNAIAEMAAGVAHNFNNNLTAIIGYIQLIKEDRGLSSGVIQDIDCIELAATKATLTVKRLLDFSRPSDDTPPMSVVDLNQTVDEVLTFCQPLVIGSQVHDREVIVKVSLGKNCLAKGSVTEMQEVVMNIVRNAFDAMPKGGTLKIQTGRDDRCVFLKITDTGVGIPPEICERIFDPFFSTKGKEGTGMGLTSSLGLIRGFNGSIEVESEKGQGTTFTVRLLAASRPSSQRALKVIGSIKDRYLLFIDDDPSQLMIVKRILDREGCHVVCCNSGREGIKTFIQHSLTSHPFDLVMCDLAMPEITGWGVVREIRGKERENKLPPVKIIIVSGSGDAVDDTLSKEKGVNAILAKPIQSQLLIKAIDEALSS